jgi:hypothetical protein
MIPPTLSRRLLRLAAILAVVLAAPTVWAETYRVGPGRTHKNLQAVARILKPGDLVEVDGNVTYPGGVTFTRPGTAADPIVIRGLLVDGKRPVISGGTNTVHFRTDVIGSGADHYVMEGFEITGGSSRCVFHQSNELTLRDVVVHDCPSYGIKGADWGAGSLTVERSEVFRCGAKGSEHQIDASADQGNYPDSVFRLQDSYLHDANGGNNVKSRAARNEIHNNRIEGAYYQELELTGSECCAGSTSNDTTVRAAALTAAVAWTPPVGIPAPSFGIAQEVADTTYTHWVNNSGSCSDSGNGTPAAPRCTIPTSLPAGAVVQVRGGPYSMSDRTWSAAGTLASPVFIRGPAAPATRPIMRFGDGNRLGLSGTYLIVENLEMQSGAVNIGSSSHHVAVRHFYLHHNPSGPGSFLGNSGDDVVIFDCEIAYNGVIPSDSDDHGIQTFSGTRNVWIVDNHIHNNSGDGIQFCHGCIGGGNGPSNVYIGRNRIHDDEENAIDIKESLGPVIVSENELYGYEPGTFSGNGDAIRLNDEGTQGQIWILNNRVHDSTICINPSGSTASSYILGNRLWNCTSTGISDSGDSTIVANNTVVNTGRGIVGGTEVRGNIVSEASNCHLCSDVSGCSNNLAWQTGGSPDVDSSCSSTVQANPLMLMSGNQQTGLQAGSPAVNAGFAHSAYTSFQTTYGLDIRRDPAGTVRPTGSAWDIGAFELGGGGGGGSTLSINDVTVSEGNSGTTSAVLTVTLSPASTSTVTVNYATANGTAAAGSDYVAQSSTLTFTPGQTSKTVGIVVNGDTSVEPNETFFVNLSAPVGATIADAQGQATITNDDAGALPTISINNVTVTEGNSGTTNAVLTVTLSQTSASTVTVNYATANGTAAAGSDYVAQSSTLSFTAGQTSRTVAIVVNGDTSVEPNETFLVNLSAPVGATIADSQGVGTINNDDGAQQVPVVWSSPGGVTVSGNSLTKTAAVAWGNAGAVSSQQIAGDGYVQVTGTANTAYRMFGLSNGNSSYHYQEIDFALCLCGSELRVYEGGVLRGSFGSFATGNLLRVAVVGSTVTYSKNGVGFYTSTATPVRPLLLDAALYTTGATLSSAVIAGAAPASVPVVWTSPVGLTVSGNSLTKTAATAWGNSGAVSSQLITGNGYVEVTGTANSTYRMFGLSNGNSSTHYQDIDYALCECGSEVRVYEGGVLRGTFGNFATGNLLRVSVVGSTVTYSRNGVAFYTSTVAPTRPLLVDAALHTTAATLNSAVISMTP